MTLRHLFPMFFNILILIVFCNICTEERGDKGEGGGNPYILTKIMEKSYRTQLLVPKLVENGGKESNFTSTGGTRNGNFRDFERFSSLKFPGGVGGSQM